MELILSKQAKKYLNKVDTATYAKLDRALEELKELRGDIKHIEGTKNMFRYKIPHYRILFKWDKGSVVIVVIEINTRTNIKY